MNFRLSRRDNTANLTPPLKIIEGREWWLWGFAIVVTVVLTLAIAALIYPGLSFPAAKEWSDLKDWVRGLAALVLLFDLYTIYQHLQLTQMRRQLYQRNLLFQLITENAADMIAVVDMEGRRIYNSPSYQTILGYTSEELAGMRRLDQIHPDDRGRVVMAAERAKLTGRGERLEYRIQHKDGSWRIFESTANAIRNAKKEIESLVIVNRDVTDRKRAEELLEYNALHDRLTHLPNRTLFLRQLERAIAFSRRHSDYRFAVLFFDIDGFKLINESLGHEAGDELLVNLGARLKASVRGLDTIARPTLQDETTTSVENKDGNLAKLGGDEYAILLDDIRHPTDAVRVATRLQGAIGTPFQIGVNEVTISVSVGIALNQASYGSPQDLLRDSEIAMNRAKLGGKSRCQVFDAAMHAQALKRLQTEAEIRRGIADSEFKVYYQPIVSLNDGRIVGLEALSRWQKADRIVLPGEFIEIADETGLIIPINRQLLLESCQNLQQWQTEYNPEPPLFLSVNIPPRQFVDPNLIDGITSVLEQTGVDRSALELEIVETVAMGEPESSGKILADLKALGIRLCIDDFGIGYSSLSRLQTLAVHALKIDRSFIQRIEVDKTKQDVVRTIVQLAHAVGLRVVAEGIEEKSQALLVTQLGCELAQGYYFSRPESAARVSSLIAKQCLGLDSDSAAAEA